MLLFYIALSILVSFLCSLLEAVILSVTPSFLMSLEKSNPQLYRRVKNLKDDVEKPLASILTFNTIAHTVGAAGAGAEAQRLFGSEVLTLFSALLTFGILFFSEIIPKSIGASSWKWLLPPAARLLGPMIAISYPIVWLSEKISQLFKKPPMAISREELAAFTQMGFADGTLAETEYRAMQRLIRFQKIRGLDILTPAPQVVGLAEKSLVLQAYEEAKKNTYSRLLVFGTSRDDIKGYVLRANLLNAYIQNPKTPLAHLVQPLLILPQQTLLTTLLSRLLARREHMAAMVGDGGEFMGIITLEDLIEHMLDLEIFDENDSQGPLPR